ncbi:hypothetical protein QW180_31270 [Vibrio sinaloensis]|nr:hypothetical protein [Vibrio sinaloensis]
MLFIKLAFTVIDKDGQDTDRADHHSSKGNNITTRIYIASKKKTDAAHQSSGDDHRRITKRFWCS